MCLVNNINSNVLEPSDVLYYDNIDNSPICIKIYKEHKTHVYFDSYEWISTSKHLSYCECGESIISSHFVKANSSICILCNGIANSTIGG